MKEPRIYGSRWDKASWQSLCKQLHDSTKEQKKAHEIKHALNLANTIINDMHARQRDVAAKYTKKLADA